MGRTTELRRALKVAVYPLLLERGFRIDQRHAPHFIDFRRPRGQRVDFLEFQWEKWGSPRFNLLFGSVGAAGTVGMGMHTLAEDVGPGQAPLHVSLHPRGTGSSTRHWFCQDAPFWLRLLGRGPRPAAQVCAELIALLPEVDTFFEHGRLGAHCFQHVQPAIRDAQ